MKSTTSASLAPAACPAGSTSPPAPALVDPRLDAILEALLAFARHDFSKRAPVLGTDNIDAIATGLNMLAEELEHTVARRQDLEEANARVVEAGHMAAVGMLAAGVAHEVNNPAAWVSLALGMIRRTHDSFRRQLEEGHVDADAWRADLDKMDVLLRDCIDGMNRITTVVDDLRNLSRADDEHEQAYEPIAIGDVIASCCRLASHLLKGVDVTIDVTEAPALVANRGRIAQVVTNLVVNAAQAIADSNTAAAERTIAIVVTTLEGGTLLAVEDSGPGIPAAIHGRVFDPFFTTRANRDGTGLGLTIVSQIATSHGGWAKVGSAHNQTGARVEVWFPSPRDRSAS